MTIFKKTARAFTLAMALLMSASAANAVQSWCNTYVQNLFIGRGGDVNIYLNIRGDYVQICAINTTWKGVSASTCAANIGLLRSAVARQAGMIIFYDDVPSCTSIPSYSAAPSPGYVMLQN
jgi:hypothetical protein